MGCIMYKYYEGDELHLEQVSLNLQILFKLPLYLCL